jgi:hypothetical protein
MKTSLVIGFLVGLLALQVGAPVYLPGVTLRPIGFDEMVGRASVIMQGRVTKLESFWGMGSALARREGEKESRSPTRRPRTALPTPNTAPSAPISVGTEGGQMIFTRVTLETISPVKGSLGNEVELVVAGGTLDGQSAFIPGMPEFEVGGTYFLFLKEDYPAIADPIVGVSQGFFQVIQDPESGQEIVLNANSDYVIGIEDDRVLSRRNPQVQARGGRPIASPTAPPVPDSPDVQSQVSAEAERYWKSTEPPMTVDDLVDAVRLRLAR